MFQSDLFLQKNNVRNEHDKNGFYKLRLLQQLNPSISLISNISQLYNMNLLDAVRKTSQYVMEHAKDVKISEEAIENLINNEKHFPASPTEALSKIEWDSSGWHYNLDASTDGPLTAQYILVLDALNFCFWPCPGLEYEHLAIGLKDALLKDPTAFDAKKLAEVDEVLTMSQDISDYIAK